MNCPVCKTSMAILEYNQVAVDFCFGCQGVWLDRGELELLMYGEPGPAPILELEKSARGRRRCPRCAARMSCGPLTGAEVEVDTCPAGHGMWLDGGELQAIARARGRGPAAEKLLQFCAEVFDAKKC